MEEFKMDKYCPSKIVGVLGVLTVFLIVLIVSGIIDINEKLKETDNVITVQGTGEVYAKPDLALTTFSVVTDAETVAEAISENTGKMNAVIAAVKADGVEEKDLKTTYFNISPRYEWRSEFCSYSYCPPGERILVGYEVNQSLEVKIRDMEKIGTIIQSATDAGANEVGNLQLTVDQQDELKNQARGEAIDEARTKAKELASELGVRLLGVSSFSENNVIPYYGLEKATAAGMGGGMEAPQIQTGENKISVTVYITYKIR